MPILKDIAQAAATIPCTERWLADGLRKGRFPGRKIGRKWMLDENDIAAIIEICSVVPIGGFSATPSPVSDSSSMTPTTARRMQQSGHCRLRE